MFFLFFLFSCALLRIYAGLFNTATVHQGDQGAHSPHGGDQETGARRGHETHHQGEARDDAHEIGNGFLRRTCIAACETRHEINKLKGSFLLDVNKLNDARKLPCCCRHFVVADLTGSSKVKKCIVVRPNLLLLLSLL